MTNAVFESSQGWRVRGCEKYYAVPTQNIWIAIYKRRFGWTSIGLQEIEMRRGEGGVNVVFFNSTFCDMTPFAPHLLSLLAGTNASKVQLFLKPM